LKAEQWHQFFLWQAGFGKRAREFVYRHTEIYSAKHVLEIGCGTGIITEEIASRTQGQVVGIDINREFLEIAKARIKAKNVEFLEMDAHNLDFQSRHFDVVYFANFLLWAQSPEKVFSEIARVLKSNGYIGILSEPDYGGRIDYPCEEIKNAVIAKLCQEKADPFIGRKLRQLCKSQGFEVRLDALWGMLSLSEIKECYEFEAEFAGIPKEKLAKAMEALTSGISFLLMPIIYGYAWR